MTEKDRKIMEKNKECETEGGEKGRRLGNHESGGGT
jgi:hypothetical protein